MNTSTNTQIQSSGTETRNKPAYYPETLPFRVWCTCGHISGHHGAKLPHGCTQTDCPCKGFESSLLAALENIECPECGHLLKCHAGKHGCEAEINDHRVIDEGPANRLCFCICEDRPGMIAAVEAIRAAKGGSQTTDPRGPIRTIKTIEETSSATLLTMDCGHVGSHAPHFSYAIGDSLHCFKCGQEGGAQ